jgi:hypothetical protein
MLLFLLYLLRIICIVPRYERGEEHIGRRPEFRVTLQGWVEGVPVYMAELPIVNMAVVPSNTDI